MRTAIVGSSQFTAAVMNSASIPENSLSQDKDVADAFADLAKIRQPRDRVSCTETEQKILELYDQLSDLRLERALLEAQASTQASINTEISDEDVKAQIKVAEREYLEARSTYLLTNSIVEDVLQVDPLLKAVHSGPNATPAEQKLHPLVDQRDILSIAQTNLSRMLQSTLNELTSVGTDNIVTMRKNQDLTATLFSLIDQLKAPKIEDIEDVELRAQVESLEVDLKEAKRRWRIVKSLVVAVVTGSGVNWAQDEELRDLVLDDEE